MGKSNREKHRIHKRSDRRADKRERENNESGGRSARLQELIREEMNFLLRNAVRNPRLDGVVVTMVQLTGDGSCARIWFTAEEEDDQRAALEDAAGFLRSQLAESLGCKRTPELRFRRDPVSRLFTRAQEEIP